MNKFSIILPVRNGGEYVKECVNSILAQTVTDFNFIILDNCSTDGTKEWIESLNDDRIIIHTADRPLTIEESWYRVTSIDKNEFITVIGHDDILYPNFLQVINDLIIKNPAASLYFTHFDLINDKGKKIRSCKPMRTTYTGQELLEAILTNSVDIMGTGYVMRARDYDISGGIPVNYPNLLYADFELWVNFASLSFEVVSPENCFAFRMHQSTAHSSKDSRLHTAMDQFINYLAALKQKDEGMKNVINRKGVEFLLFYCKGFCHRLLRSDIKKREGMTVERMIHQTKLWAKKTGLENDYHPEQLPSIRIAKIIDSNPVFRKMFLLFKKIYPASIIRK